MIVEHVVVAAPAVPLGLPLEALCGTGDAFARLAAQDLSEAPTGRRCGACDQELLDEQLTCPPCWLEGDRGSTSILRAMVASLTAMLRR